MSDRNPLPGKFVWFEHVSRDARRAQAFYRDVLGWKSRPFPEDSGYDMIFTGDTDDTMFGGYAAPRLDRQPPHWISYVSVDDVDAAARAAVEHGGRVVEPPADLPGVGRMARIADPQGAEIWVFKNATGDPADTQATHGRCGTSSTRPIRQRRSTSTRRFLASPTARSIWGRTGPTTSCRRAAWTAAVCRATCSTAQGRTGFRTSPWTCGCSPRTSDEAWRFRSLWPA